VQREGAAKPLELYSSIYDKREAIKKAYATGGYTLKQIAAHFGLHYSTVSRIVNKET
jgi:transposase